MERWSDGVIAVSHLEMSRRNFCKWSSSLVLTALFPHRSSTATAEDVSEPVAELHAPKLILPAITKNGSHVPIVARMNHPLETRHHIRQIEFVNESDPIPSKGVFHPTPANGELYFSFQARIDSGASTVMAIAECNLHGRWTARQRIMIPEGQGGCVTAGPEKKSFQNEAIPPPVIRIPELVRHGRLARGTTADVQVKFKHPSSTGLAYANKKFVQVEEPFYLTLMELFYGDHRVSRYEMTPGLSDNPFLTLKLRFTEEKPIHVVFTNSRGQQFKAVHQVVLS